MTLAAPRSRQSRLTLVLAILAATVALGGGLLFWSSQASADINTAAASVAQTSGPTTPQPGDLITYTFTLVGATGGTTANTQLIGTVDGGVPVTGPDGSNANIESITGAGIFVTAGECVIDVGAKSFTCTDATGVGCCAGTTVVIGVRVLPTLPGDNDLNPPQCLLQDNGLGSVSCTTSITQVPISTGAPAAATNPPGVPHTFTFVLADGVTCESDPLDNDTLRTCTAADVTITGTCTLVSGPTVADSALGNDSNVTVTINSATEQSCTVTLLVKFDPQTCVPVVGPPPVPCTGATFVDINDLSADKTFSLGDGVIRHLDIPDAATEDAANIDTSSFCTPPPQGPCGLLDDVHDDDDATGSQHGACLEDSTLTHAANSGMIEWQITPVNGGPNPVPLNGVEFAGPYGEPCVRWSAATVGSQSIYATFDPDGAGPIPAFDIFYNGTPDAVSGLCNPSAPIGLAGAEGPFDVVCLPLVKEWNDIDFTEIVSVTGNVGDDLSLNTLELGGNQSDWVNRNCADSNSGFCARPNQDGQNVLQGGVAIGGGGFISANGRSFIDYVYGNHNTNGGAYPDPQAPETGVACFDALDNDNDGIVNDGCPTVGTPETGSAVGPAAPGDCDNVVDDDQDGRINDGCPAVSVGPVDGVEQTYTISGSCGSVRLENPTTGLVIILTLTNPTATVLSSDKGVGFQILPNSTGTIATTLTNANCGPNAEVCVTISSEEENLFRSPPIDDAADEEVCARFVVGPPTNKTPVLAWAGMRVVVEADWAVYTGSALTAETGTDCDNATDDDGDGFVNDGCPADGLPETVAQCGNAIDDDPVDDALNGAPASSVNDGCSTQGVISDRASAPTTTVALATRTSLVSFTPCSTATVASLQRSSATPMTSTR